jgi:hypothetical protein
MSRISPFCLAPLLVILPAWSDFPGPQVPQGPSKIVAWPAQPNDYPMRFPIGSGHDSVFYSLMRLAKDVEYTVSIVAIDESQVLLGDNELPFDSYYRIRWAPAAENQRGDGREFCYFFRRGFLVAMCPAPAHPQLRPQDIFDREIRSGLYHPPSYPDLLAHVTWGEISGCRWWNNEERPVAGRDEATEAIHRPRLRCGIAVDHLPPFARRNKLNVLILIHNIDTQPMSIRMPIKDMIPGSVALAAFQKGSYSWWQPVAIGGTPLTTLLSGATEPFCSSAVSRVAPIQLQPDQYTWLWLTSEIFGDPGLILRTRVSMLGLNSANVVSEYKMFAEIPSTSVTDPNAQQK